MELETVTPDNIPKSIDRVIQALITAKTYAQQEAAIEAATIVIDAFEIAKKLNVNLEEQLEAARRDIIKVITDVKIKRVRKYDRAKKSGEVQGQGKPKVVSEKEKGKRSEPSDLSEKPKLNDMDMNKRRIFEDRKVSGFEKKHPGVIHKIIDEKPKTESVPRNIGLKAAKFADKHPDTKPEEIIKKFKEESQDREEKRRYKEDMKKKREFINENKTTAAIVREIEHRIILIIDKAAIDMQQILRLAKLNNNIILSHSFLSTLNKWRFFLSELHKVYPLDDIYNGEHKKDDKNTIIIDLKAN